KLEQLMGSKNSINVLRHLTLYPYLSFGLTKLSEELKISKSNILRVTKPLIKEKIILEKQSARKKVYQINSEHNLTKELWKLFMVEKQSLLPAYFKNGIDLFYEKVKDSVEVFIVFGSVARSLATEDSDIDVLIIGDKKLHGPIIELPYRFEVHNYSWKDLENKTDFVVLESLMEGICYQGDIFKIIKELKLFSKNYLIYRLNKAKEFLKKGNKLDGEAKRYYLQLAQITLGEIYSVLKHKKTESKRDLKAEATFKNILKIEEELSKEGDNIWLI
ncbi:MAG: nucleotidyltransferase domain-containing protein, partial [Candidatus Woesearchaeota archaeon]